MKHFWQRANFNGLTKQQQQLFLFCCRNIGTRYLISSRNDKKLAMITTMVTTASRCICAMFILHSMSIRLSIKGKSIGMTSLDFDSALFGTIKQWMCNKKLYFVIIAIISSEKFCFVHDHLKLLPPLSSWFLSSWYSSISSLPLS